MLFRSNWIYLSSVLVILFVFFLVYKNAVKKWLIKRKIAYLEVEKQTFKNLIRRTQKNYFELGKMSESGYVIKTKKFAELIRDIDRQIPLLKEEFVKIQRKEKGKRQIKNIKQEERQIVKKQIKDIKQKEKQTVKKQIKNIKNKEKQTIKKARRKK